MDAQTLEPPKNGHGDQQAISDRLSPPPQTPLCPPTLKEAVAALPATDGGDLTRRGLGPLLEQGDLRGLVGRTVDELSSLRTLVEVLRCAATETEAPIDDTINGIDALADVIRERLRRLQGVLQGVAGAMPS